MNGNLLEEVGAKLNKAFDEAGYSINADTTYLTSVVVNDLGQQVVDYSESLSWAIMEKVQADELPEFDDTFTGVFSERWTFEPAYKMIGLDVAQINASGRVVVESYRNK